MVGQAGGTDSQQGMSGKSRRACKGCKKQYAGKKILRALRRVESRALLTSLLPAPTLHELVKAQRLGNGGDVRDQMDYQSLAAISGKVGAILSCDVGRSQAFADLKPTDVHMSLYASVSVSCSAPGTLAEELIGFLGELLMSEVGSTPAPAAALVNSSGRSNSNGSDHSSAEGAQHLRAAALLAELRSDPRLHRPLALRERLAQAAGSNVRMGLQPGFIT
jgi:hypothetical protein